jgi:hypothetical protein
MRSNGVVIRLTEQQRAIEAAFRKLPIRRGPGPGISYEFFIPDIARSLMMMRRFDGQKKVRVEFPAISPDDTPKKRDVVIGIAPPAGGREWKKLARYSKAQVELLDSYDFGDLNFQPHALKRLRFLLGMLECNALEGAKCAPLSNGRDGRPPKAAAAAVTARVAVEFRRLTGKTIAVTKPTDTSRINRRSGAGVTLLQSVFDALGIKASAAVQIDKYRKVHRKA